MSNQSWTDSLEVCADTGVGFSLNRAYRENGNHQEDHFFEDCKCLHKFSPICFYYAVLDGHGGSKIAKFCSEKLAAELYFAPLKDDTTVTDDAVRTILR